MKLSQIPGSLKRFRRTSWRFQQTFHTPLTTLKPFVGTIASALEPLSGGCVTIDQAVFEPKHLISLLTAHSLPAEYGQDWSLTAEGQPETEALLEAALGDWVDFLFVPAPKPFVIYADHDEYTTFYANTKSNLNRVAQALSANGFENIPDYERQL
jgi:hypothetical protein